MRWRRIRRPRLCMLIWGWICEGGGDGMDGLDGMGWCFDDGRVVMRMIGYR